MDGASYLVGFGRLAPLQIMLLTRGRPSGIPEIDYYVTASAFTGDLVPAFLTSRSESTGGEERFPLDLRASGERIPAAMDLSASSRDNPGQVVVTEGFGMHLEDLRAAFMVLDREHVSLSRPLRYEYYGHVFLERQNIYLVLTPVQQAHPLFDRLVSRIVLEDPQVGPIGPLHLLLPSSAPAFVYYCV